MRRLARYTAVFLITLFAVYMVWFFRTIIGMFVASLALAALFRPIFQRLHERGINRGLALAVTYAGLFAIFAVAGWWLIPILLEESQALVSFAAVQYEISWDNKESFAPWQTAILNLLPDPEIFYGSLIEMNGTSLPQPIIDSVSALATLLGSLPLIVMLSIYWASGQEQFERLWLSLLSAPNRMNARALWRDIEMTLGGYLRSELFQVVASFFILAIGLYIIEYPYPVLLSLIAALLMPLPLFGSPLAIVAVILCSVFQKAETTVAAATLTASVHLFFFFFVEPRLVREWRYNPLLALFIIILLVETVGFVGLFLAPPLSALIQITLRALLMRQDNHQIRSLDELTERVQVVEASFAGEIPPEFSSIIERLNELIAQTQQKIEST